MERINTDIVLKVLDKNKKGKQNINNNINDNNQIQQQNKKRLFFLRR